MVATNNTVTGNYYVGGNDGGLGWANVINATSENNKIKGNAYVGGCIGIGDSYYSYTVTLRYVAQTKKLVVEAM